MLGGKANKKVEEAFDKDELQTIIKFGAADLFTGDGEEGDQEKEVDLDAILEKAEVRQKRHLFNQTQSFSHKRPAQ